MLCAFRGTIGRKAPESSAFRRVRICRSTLKSVGGQLGNFMLEQVDSSAFRIASQMLRNIDFTVEDIVKEGEERHLFISIGFNGSNKGKLIILKKEEGEWKVSQIADRS